MPKFALFSKKYSIFFILFGYVLFLGFYENYLGIFLFFIIGAILCIFSKNKILVLFLAILLSFFLSAVNPCIEEGFEEEDEDADDDDDDDEKKEEEKPVVIDINKPLDQLSDKEKAKIRAELNQA